MPTDRSEDADFLAGVSPDARETWPSSSLIDSWLGDEDVDFQFRPGEDVAVHDDPAARAAARLFRDVVGRFASGITVVTTMSGEEPIGMTLQSFCSVSLEPPLVLFSPAKTSRAWPLMQRSGRLAINVLAADQQDVSNQMATRGIDKFDGITWQPGPVTGSPLIDGVLAHLDCTIHAVHEAGDHYVVLARVEHLAAGADAGTDAPLLYFQGGYRTTD
ncbi:flavin reductase family protein [Nocardioides panacisoli]|uniref:flavin reductase family protein n=1 Tax=Nocardioides panacisoli TaxID=627624 RepID=UPI001C631814|nr:flavin reductase family protein [Nocardioides panacisoli]QYJ04915.1 flavin reductase family protein [Nocardioides panacisoli]